VESLIQTVMEVAEVNLAPNLAPRAKSKHIISLSNICILMKMKKISQSCNDSILRFL
jgi:hypothetical protein